MAISKNNLFLQGFSGKVGNVIIKQYKDKTVLSSIPDMSNIKRSKKQKASNILMEDANVYAKSITSDPRQKEEACRALKVAPNKVFREIVKQFLRRKGEVTDMIKIL